MKNSRSLRFFVSLLFTGAIVASPVWVPPLLAKDKDKEVRSPHKTPTPKPTPGKCEVCHNPHNYHTISIPCEQVDKFLKNHPGDYRGPCRATPTPTPKPTATPKHTPTPKPTPKPKH